MQGIEGVLRVVACVRESLPGPSCTAWPPDHAPVPGVTDFMQFPRKILHWAGKHSAHNMITEKFKGQNRLWETKLGH